MDPVERALMYRPQPAWGSKGLFVADRPNRPLFFSPSLKTRFLHSRRLKQVHERLLRGLYRGVNWPQIDLQSEEVSSN